MVSSGNGCVRRLFIQEQFPPAAVPPLAFRRFRLADGSRWQKFILLLCFFRRIKPPGRLFYLSCGCFCLYVGFPLHSFETGTPKKRRFSGICGGLGIIHIVSTAQVEEPETAEGNSILCRTVDIEYMCDFHRNKLNSAETALYLISVLR